MDETPIEALSEVSAEIIAPPPPMLAAAPVPLTVVPEVPVEVATEATVTSISVAPRAKRKYIKRDKHTKKAKSDMPRAKKVKMASKPRGRPPMKARTTKVPRKMKRLAGTKAQGQIPKAAMRFAKNVAKEKDITVGALVGTGVVRYLKSLGWDPEA